MESMTSSPLKNSGVPSSAVPAAFTTLTLPFSQSCTVTLYCGSPSTVTCTEMFFFHSSPGRVITSSPELQRAPVPSRITVPLTVKVCSRWDCGS